MGGGREGERERRRGAAGRCKWLNARARAAQKLRSPRGPRRARPLCFPAQWRAHTHGAGGRGSPGADLLRVAGSAEKSRCRGGNRTAAAAGRGARRPRGGEAGTAPPGRAEGNSPAEAPSGGDGVGGRLAAGPCRAPPASRLGSPALGLWADRAAGASLPLRFGRLKRLDEGQVVSVWVWVAVLSGFSRLRF